MRNNGSKALGARLLAIPQEVLDELRPALLKGAHDIADAMELLVPEDDGDLLGSIAVTGPNDTTPAYAAGGSVTMKPNQAAVTVGNTEVRHGHLQEFGTVNHDAQPFMRPAFRLKRTKVMRRIATAVRKAIQKAGS